MPAEEARGVMSFCLSIVSESPFLWFLLNEPMHCGLRKQPHNHHRIVEICFLFILLIGHSTYLQMFGQVIGTSASPQIHQALRQVVAAKKPPGTGIPTNGGGGFSRGTPPKYPLIIQV